MLAFAVETLPRAREGYTLSWRWVQEQIPLMGSQHIMQDASTSGERERDVERDVEGREVAGRGGG